MAVRLIKFPKKPNSPTIPLDSKGPKDSGGGAIVDYGTIGNLSYNIYRRGVIHICDSNGLIFKKDINLFEEEVKKVDLSSDESIIKGSGDNDHLVFKKESGELVISLKKREYSAMETLKSILEKGKKLVSSGGSK